MNEVINDSDEYLRVGSGFPSHESSNDKETTQSKIDQIQYSKCSVFNKIILKAKKKLFADIIFLDYAFLSAIWLSHSQLWNIIKIWTKVHQESCNEVGFKIPAKCLIEFELGTFHFIRNVLTNKATLQRPWSILTILKKFSKKSFLSDLSTWKHILWIQNLTIIIKTYVYLGGKKGKTVFQNQWI